MAPIVRIAGDRTLEHVWARCDDVRLLTCLSFDDPFSEGVDEAESLRRAWLNKDQDTVIAEPLP